MLDQIHYPSYLLQRMDSPNKAWLREHRETREPPYDTLNDKPGKFPEQPTRDEIIEFRRQRDEEIRRRKQEEREAATSGSFGSQCNKVKIDFRGATFTLDSTDEQGIKRVMNLINGGR